MRTLKLQTLVLCFFCGFSLSANIEQLITQNDWNNLYPNRAGTQNNHPQGYNSDFYSYSNLQQAINEMEDYLVEIKIKQGVWGQLATITKKSSNESYVYSDVDQYWHSSNAPQSTIYIDFGNFINRENSDNNIRELAAFLAHISKETTGGWQRPVGSGTIGDHGLWGLYFVHEVGYDSNSSGAYSSPHNDFPPNPNKSYYGRGPMQLSWNYNYGQLSKFLYNDASILLNQPEQLEQDGVLAFKSAIWFWMMPQWPKPSCHQIMHEIWEPMPGEYTMPKMYQKGFAHTNNIINGGLECRQNSSASFIDNVELRAELYQYYLEILGFNSAQIEAENQGDYALKCNDNASNYMEEYVSAFVVSSDEISLKNLSVFPNPFKDWINVKSESSIHSIEIFNLKGQSIYQQKLQSSQQQIALNMLKSGTYLLKLNLNSEAHFFKIIKE